MADRYINPATGSDANSGASAALAWATLGQAATYMTANPGVVTRLLIDTSAAPLYVTSQPSWPNLTSVGLKCTIMSATKDYADIRAWELKSGASAFAYNTRYGGSGQSNIYGFVTREFAAIWEYTGSWPSARHVDEEGGLIWLDHIVKLGASSATHSNATNLSNLQGTAWTFWTGSDGTDQVTLFNANGSPAGRQFAVTRFVGQVFQVAGGYTLERIMVGGVTGVSATGVVQTGYSIHASDGCHINDCIPYAGSTHAIGQLEGGAACTFNDVYIGIGPGYVGYTPFVFHSIQSTAKPPTLNRCTCKYSQSVRGSKIGTWSHATAFMVSTAYCHGTAAVTNDYTFNDCDFDGMIEMSSDHTNFNPRLVVNGGTVGRIGISATVRAMTALVNRTKLTKQILSQSGHSGHSTTFTDCLADLTITTTSSQVAGVRGTMTMLGCTVLCPGVSLGGDLSERSLIRGTIGEVQTLSFHDCIFRLINDNGETIHLTLTVDLDAGGTITSNRNIYLTTSSSAAIHRVIKSGGAFPNWTFTQTQAAPLSQEAQGSEYTSNLIYLNSAGVIASRNSPTIGAANARTNAPDFTGKIFATRNDRGAFEWQDEPVRPYSVGDLNSLLVPYTSPHTLSVPLYEPGTTLPAVLKTLAFGDIRIRKDGGALTNLVTAPGTTDSLGRVPLVLTDAELTAERIEVQIADTSVAKEFDDLSFVLSTFGLVDAQLPSLPANSDVIVSDFDDETVPPDRTWTVIESPDGGLVGDRTLRMRQGTTPTFAIDFRNDLAVNGKVISVAVPTILSGSSSGLSFGSRGRRGSQAKIRITGVTVGVYTFKVVVTYHNLDTQAAILTLEVV